MLKKDRYNLKLLEEVVNIVASGKNLPEKYKNHPLKGRYIGYYDCHILPDWILIYKLENERVVLILFDMGTHADLFK